MTRAERIEAAARALMDSDIALCDHVTDSREWDRQMCLLHALREALSPPSPTSANGECECPPDFQRHSSIPGAHTPSCPAVRAPPEAARCGECLYGATVCTHAQCQPGGSGRSGGSR